MIDRTVMRAVRAGIMSAVVMAVLAGCTGDDGRAATTESTRGSTPDTAATDTAPAPRPSEALFESVCTGAPDIVDVGTIASPDITEASGLVASGVNTGAWWIHNDSGDSARIFAIDDAGELLATVSLEGAEARDWEDIAVGPTPGLEALTVYVGDTGDNAVMKDPAGGRGSIRVYRFVEPVIDADGTPQDLSVPVDTLIYEFPDAAHDVEAMLVDPVDGDLVVVTKDWQRTGASQVYRAPADVAAGSTTQLEAVGTVPLERATLITGADVTRDGSLVALRSYGAVHLYERTEGEPLWSAFETVPCEGPVPTELQGESLGFAPAGDAYVTVSEGEHATLHRTA